MSVFFMVISVIAAIFSCACAGLTFAEYRAYKRALKAMQRGTAKAKYEVLETTVGEPKKGTINYPDMSSGPRYREYGDLS